jgi:hypothetical protein
MTYIRASEVGCALDCDLQNGRNKYTGGTATDDGPRINAAMAGATASNPITLIIDGSALISGLFLPAGGYWGIAGLGCGTGFFIKSGTNNDGIHNGGPNAGAPSDPGPPAPARGSSVSLSNFTLNGNQGNGRSGDSTTGIYQGNTAANHWYFGINLMSINNINIANLVVVNSPSYHMRLSNVGNVTVSGCVMRSNGANTDGLHFDGPANDIAISNCDFTLGDDAIALNCPEGYHGDISRVAVTNCTFNSRTLMRLDSTYAGYNFNIDNVTVSNCSGTLLDAGFLIGDDINGHANSITSVAISDCNLTAPSILGVGTNFGTIALSNITLVPLSTNQSPGFAFVRTPSFFGGLTYVGSSLSLTNCVISRNANSEVAAIILENGSSINNLEFNGFAVQNAVGKSYPAVPELLNIVSGSIGQLVLDALSSNNIKALITAGEFSNIGSVSGTGVLATGWAFPDAVMTNGVPYISANSHLPSIKVEGVVEPYPPA